MTAWRWIGTAFKAAFCACGAHYWYTPEVSDEQRRWLGDHDHPHGWNDHEDRACTWCGRIQIRLDDWIEDHDNQTTLEERLQDRVRRGRALRLTPGERGILSHPEQRGGELSEGEPR